MGLETEGVAAGGRHRRLEVERRRLRGLGHFHFFSILLLFHLLWVLLLATGGRVHAAAFVPSQSPSARRGRGRGALVMKLRAKQEGPGNNAAANLYVDRSCSGCGTCRAMCPGVFGSLGLKTAVQRAPKDEEETRRAVQAMVTCPYGAIRLRKPDPVVKSVVEEDFPIPVDPEALPGIYHLGYHHRQSMGATPYLIVRPGGKGNVMVDAPRFNGRLARQVEALGGVAYHIITHEGAAPDHDYWHAFFPHAERVVHRMDVTRGMRDEVEAALNGKGPWMIDDDIKIIALPGYTPGSIGLVYRLPPWASASASASALASQEQGQGATVLFSGRTVGWSPRLNQLDGFAQFSRGNLHKQAESMRALAEEEWGFGWVLPAEGTRYRFPSPQARAPLLREAADRFVERGRLGGLSM